MPQRQDGESSDSEDENEGSKKKRKGGNQDIRPLESFEVRKKKKERSMFFVLYCILIDLYIVTAFSFCTVYVLLNH